VQTVEGLRKPEDGTRQRIGTRCVERTLPTERAKRRETSWKELLTARAWVAGKVSLYAVGGLKPTGG